MAEPLNSYKLGEMRRQRFIDLLIEIPGLNSIQIIAEMSKRYKDKRQVHVCLAQMSDMGELYRVKKNNLWYYTARVKTTVKAEILSSKRLAASNLAKAKMTENTKKYGKPVKIVHNGVIEPWRTVHIGGKLKSTNQGGQGAIRERVYAGICEI